METASGFDIVAFGAHPDDVELGCGGTLAMQVSKGNTACIIDLTQGELGTRGTPEIRKKESDNAAEILGVSERCNMGFADGFFTNDKEHQLQVIALLRKYRPRIVLANALSDRHPDHGRAGQLVAESCFLSGLAKIVTESNGEKLEPWRPMALYHYIQYRNHKPDVIVDISDHFDVKMKAVRAHESQFHNPSSKEPETLISQKDFLEHITGNALDMAKQIGCLYAEGFTSSRHIGASNLLDLI